MEILETEEPRKEIKSEEKPSLDDITKGITLFSIMLIAYAFYCLGVKVSLNKFTLNVPEIMYYYSVMSVPWFYVALRINKINLLGIEHEDRGTFVKRILVGFAGDSLLFVAMGMTSYSKAYCLFFTNTLMSPFLAKWMVDERIKTWDIVGIVFGFIGMLMMV